MSKKDNVNVVNLRRIENNNYDKYIIMLSENVYKELNIPTYTNYFIERKENLLIFNVLNLDSYAWNLRDYLEYHKKIIDENNAKNAKPKYSNKELNSINLLKRSICMDTNEIEYKKIFKEICMIFFVDSLIFDTDSNNLDVIINKKIKNKFKYKVKCNNINYEKMLDGCYENIDEKVNFICNKVKCDRKLYDTILNKICLLDINSVIRKTEIKNDIIIPEEIKELLNLKIQNIIMFLNDKKTNNFRSR